MYFPGIETAKIVARKASRGWASTIALHFALIPLPYRSWLLKAAQDGETQVAVGHPLPTLGDVQLPLVYPAAAHLEIAPQALLVSGRRAVHAIHDSQKFG